MLSTLEGRDSITKHYHIIIHEYKNMRAFNTFTYILYTILYE